MQRCKFASKNPLMQQYHDIEWGVKIFNPDKLFAKLMLDGLQAGLSWNVILQKRKEIYIAFDDFDSTKICKYDECKIHSLLQNEKIIRNKTKIMAIIHNAKIYDNFITKYGKEKFVDIIWQFNGRIALQPKFADESKVLTISKESEKLSHDLVKIGFKFVGPVIIYAFMQAVGVTNDHVISCFRHKELA